MIVKRPAAARGTTELGWLHSRHTFSFADYFDTDQMGFRSLRVINDDIVEGGGGFGMHAHRDAEIFSYVIEGALQHRDSMGNGSVLRAGNVQYMSAGRGVMHSEFNPSDAERVHFLQVWILPDRSGGEPQYAEVVLGERAPRNALTLFLSGEEREGVQRIRQDAHVYFGRLDAQQGLELMLEPDRHGWLHVIRGRLRGLGEEFGEGDGAAVSEVERLPVVTEEDAEFMWFDLR